MPKEELTDAQLNFISGAAKGDQQEVEYRINNGVNINVKDKDGMAALHHAALNGRLEIVRLLLANSAKIDVKNDTEGNTPLHCAVQGGHTEVVLLLLDSGANYRLKNNYKETLNIDTVEHRTTTPYDYLSHENFFYIQKGKERLDKKPQEIEFNLTKNKYREYNNVKIDIQKGLTPLELAHQMEKLEIAEIIANFIFQQEKSITQATRRIPEIKDATDKISELEKEIKELKQLALKSPWLQQKKSQSIFPSPPALVYSKSLHLAMVFVLAALCYLRDNKEMSYAFGAILVLMASYYAEQMGIKIVEEYNSAKRELERLKNNFSEVLVQGVALIKTTRTTVQHMGEASKTIADAVRDLQQTTDVVLLEFKDELSGLVYELKGTGKQVADAFDYGVKHGAFKPEVNANVNVQAHIPIRADSLFPIFKL